MLQSELFYLISPVPDYLIMTTSTYSSTRYLTREKPICFDEAPDDVVTLFKTPDGNQKISEGGLRLQGLYKKNSEDKPLITVVTVVFNGVEFLEDTIKSVIEQTYDNVEYIIVDGGSKDGTLDIIKKYEYAIDYWVSEPDKGIYDAMNKAIDLGSGDWINFMNAGDCFFDSTILSKVFGKSREFVGYDVVYGDNQVKYSNRTRIAKAGNVKNLWKGSQFCHQSVFIRLSHHKKNKFNISKKIAADFEFFYKAHKNGLKFLYFPFTLSKISAGGISDKDRVGSILDQWQVVEKTVFINIYYACRVLAESIKSLIKKALS